MVLLTKSKASTTGNFSATTTYSFVVWDFDKLISREKHGPEKKKIEDEEEKKEDADEEVSYDFKDT